MILAITIICYIILALSLIVPFRISSAEIRAYAGEMISGPAPDWGEGWQEVQRAVRRFGWSREKEALSSLSPSARTAAERIGWMDICCSENAETLRAQFRQVFQAAVERDQRDALIAPEVRAMIAGIVSETKMITGQTE